MADNLKSRRPFKGPKVTIFTCCHCDVTFSRIGNLRTHERNIHSIDNRKRTQICGMCNEKTRTVVDLHKHIENQHPDLKLCFYHKLFYCQSDFDQWKVEVERQSVTSFILTGKKVYDSCEVRYYKCHRSGIGTSVCETKRKRHSKYAGTIKTGIACPAMIKATKETFHEATQITVEYQSTHIGHKCEVGKLRLQKKDRTEVACMLKSGVPINVVLNRTQAQYSPTKRLGLITRQDIYNVVRDFNVNSESSAKGHLFIDVSEKEMSENTEKSIILKQTVQPKEDLSGKKSAIEQALKDISSNIQASESLEDLQFVADIIQSIQSYLGITNKSQFPSFPSKTDTPSTKMICL